MLHHFRSIRSLVRTASILFTLVVFIASTPRPSTAGGTYYVATDGSDR